MIGENLKANVPTDLLRTLVTVCELGNVTKAAQVLQLTELAISQQIKKLELIIGSSIIDRSLSGITLTRDGLEILKSAQRMLSINDQIIFECGDDVGLRAIRVGVPSLFATMLLPDIVKEIRSKAPDAQLQICCDNSPNLLRIFRLGYLDIAFVYCDANDAADAACSWTEEIGWVRAPDFTIGSDEPVPLVGSPNVMRVDQIAIEALKRIKRSYHVVFSAIDFGARLAAVAAGLGYLPLTRRLVPPNFVIDDDDNTLPPLGTFKVGIFVRKEFDKKYVRSLVAGLEAIARPGSNVR
jgi:DNA-binding transcriptional LysR family regulator